jgi:hypothetical protein
MKAIVFDWQYNESVGSDEVAVFSDDNDPNIKKLYNELCEGWPDEEHGIWKIRDYIPPRLDPRSLEECDFTASFLARRQPPKPPETEVMDAPKNFAEELAELEKVTTKIENVLKNPKGLGYHEGSEIF